MSKECLDFQRRGVLIYDGSAEDLRRLAGLLERAATAEVDPPGLTVASPEAAEDMVRTLLSGLCGAYAAEPGNNDSGVYRRVLKLVDRSMVEATLQKCGGCQLRAAEILGINRNTLRSKMRELDISSDDFA